MPTIPSKFCFRCSHQLSMEPASLIAPLPSNVSIQLYTDPQLETLDYVSLSLLPSMNVPFLSNLDVVDFASVNENILIQQLLGLTPMPYIDPSLDYQGEVATPAISSCGGSSMDTYEMQSLAKLQSGLVPPQMAAHTELQRIAENLVEATLQAADSGTGVPDGGCVPGSKDENQAADTWFPVHNLGMMSPKSETDSRSSSHSRPNTAAGKGKPARQKTNRVRVYTVRSHPCTLCESSFFRKQDLDRHGAVHGLGVSLACSRGCGRVFTRRDALGRHLKSVKCVQKSD